MPILETNIHVMFIYSWLIFTRFSQLVDNLPVWTGMGRGPCQVGECGIAWSRPLFKAVKTGVP